MRAWLAILVLALGCAPRESAAWMPQLVVRGRMIERVGSERHRWDWQVHGALSWRMGAAPRREPGEPAAREMPRETVRCADVQLCAWERRARERAYREALRELEGEEP